MSCGPVEDHTLHGTSRHLVRCCMLTEGLVAPRAGDARSWLMHLGSCILAHATLLARGSRVGWLTLCFGCWLVATMVMASRIMLLLAICGSKMVALELPT